MGSNADTITPAEIFAALVPGSPYLLASRVDCFPGVAMRTSRGRGRGLFATVAFAAGDVILREPAAVWQAGGELFSPFDLATLDVILLQAAPYALTATTAATAPRAARTVVVERVLDANAYSLALGGDADVAAAPEESDAGGARALFPVVALANSSCDANAKAEQALPDDATDADFGGLPVSVLTAQLDIAAGDEICTCYVPRAWHKSARRTALRDTYGFECTCARCASSVDDTVVLRCGASCGSGGRVYWECAAGVSGVCVVCGVSGGIAPPCVAPGQPLDVEDAPAGANVAALVRVADALLRHAVLDAGDARVFAALGRLLDATSAVEARGGRDAAGAGAVSARIAQALEAAASVSRFTSVGELPFDIEE